DLLGRSIPVHQITTGEARGGKFKGPSDTIPQEYLQSLQRGNLRPEYYNLAYANRYTYPSFFAVRGLIQGGVLTADEGYQILPEMGWKPDLARKTADFYGVPAAAAGDKHLAKAQVQLWTATHRAYLTGELTDADATTALTQAGVPGASVVPILQLWQ